jgi:hypothetical protein
MKLTKRLLFNNSFLNFFFQNPKCIFNNTHIPRKVYVEKSFQNGMVHINILFMGDHDPG